MGWFNHDNTGMSQDVADAFTNVNEAGLALTKRFDALEAQLAKLQTWHDRWEADIVDNTEPPTPATQAGSTPSA